MHLEAAFICRCIKESKIYCRSSTNVVPSFPFSPLQPIFLLFFLLLLFVTFIKKEKSSRPRGTVQPQHLDITTPSFFPKSHLQVYENHKIHYIHHSQSSFHIKNGGGDQRVSGTEIRHPRFASAAQITHATHPFLFQNIPSIQTVPNIITLVHCFSKFLCLAACSQVTKSPLSQNPTKLVRS
jgi:hypothetical protein